MTPVQYIEEQLRLECIGLDNQYHLVRISGSHPDEIHRLYLFKFGAAVTVLWRGDVDIHTKARFSALDAFEAFSDPDLVSREVSLVRRWCGSTYVFPSQFRCDSVGVFEQNSQFIVYESQSVASTAWSSRSNSTAAELAVETQPQFRRRGFAARAAGTWAKAQQQLGRIAFFSHKDENYVSRQLARHLGVVHVFDCRSFA